MYEIIVKVVELVEKCLSNEDPVIHALRIALFVLLKEL